MATECTYCDSEGWLEYDGEKDRYVYCPFCDNNPDIDKLLQCFGSAK